jgi:tetrahydromethanopterin S-methyltransferase subunit G
MSPEQASQFLMDYGPIIWTVFLIAVILAAFIKIWPFISKVVRTIDIISELPDRLDKIEARLMGVEHEVKTNGGSSIKDAVKRIEDHLNKI